uniref:GOLD domain-containing protein n=1 Tax=Spongospora subterranea TaxID=70186 RepID=A0A0H5RKJ6_9EUKA|eukprot:CRZ09254.1 hypothetical protein [Spongospora subterranea]
MRVYSPRSSITLLGCIFFINMACATIYELFPGKPYCIGDDAEKNDLFRGKYIVKQGQPGQVDIVITDSNQREVLRKTGDVESSWLYTATAKGEIRVCMFNKGGFPVKVDLEMGAGPAAKDYDAIAKKENLKPLELELRRLEDLISSVKSDFEYYTSREQEARSVNESTNSRVLIGFLVSMAFILGIGTWQLYVLQKYFTSKKMM